MEKVKRKLFYILILFVIMLIGIITKSNEQVMNLKSDKEYTFFSSNLSADEPIVLSGKAFFLDGNVKLTDAVSGRIGGLFSENKIDGKYGFELYFCLSTDSPSVNGGDGFCIVLSKNENKCKNYGGYLGARLTDSIELEIDMFTNYEPKTPHLYLWKDGVNITHKEAGTVHLDRNIVSRGDFYVWVEYNNLTKNMDIFVSKTSQKPDIAVATYKIDVEKEIGNLYYVGVTSATGEDYQSHWAKEFGWHVKECEHQDTTYVDNGDDTHKESCFICGKIINESMQHIFENGEFCSMCGAEKLNEIEVIYIDEINGEEIATSEKIKVHNGEEYQTSSKKVTGYELVEVPTNATGIMTEDKITVIYKYRKLLKVVVKYIDLYSGEEIDRVENIYKEEESYITDEKDIEGYRLINVPENKEGVVGREDIEVLYGYRKISGGIIVRYIDEVTNEEILTSENKVGLVGEDYETKTKKIVGYELLGKPENEKGILSEEEIIVTYKYRKLSKVIVIYKDKESGKEISREEREYKEGDSYKVKSKEISGYKLIDTSKNEEGIIERKDIEVIYYYDKEKVFVKVEINIVDDSGNVIERIEKEGYLGDKEELELPEIDGYYTEEKSVVIEYGKENNIKIIYKKKIFDLPNTSDINIYLYIIVFIVSVAITSVFIINKIRK